MPLKPLPHSSRELLKLYRAGATLEELAKKCKVSRPAIQRRLSSVDPDFIGKRRRVLARTQSAQILRSLRQGKSSTEIGRDMGLTTTTIKCLIAEQPRLRRAQKQRQEKQRKRRVLDVIRVLEEREPEIPSLEEIAHVIGLKPATLLVWLRRNYPQVIAYVSNKPNREQKQERRERLLVLKSEHPEYSLSQLAEAMGMRYGTLAGWLIRNPIHTPYQEEE